MMLEQYLPKEFSTISPWIWQQRQEKIHCSLSGILWVQQGNFSHYFYGKKQLVDVKKVLTQWKKVFMVKSSLLMLKKLFFFYQNGLTQPHFCACPTDLDYVMIFGQWLELRGGNLFCWFWCNCLPSLFKLLEEIHWFMLFRSLNLNFHWFCFLILFVNVRVSLICLLCCYVMYL